MVLGVPQMMQVTPTLNFNERSQFEKYKILYKALTLTFWDEKSCVDDERLEVAR